MSSFTKIQRILFCFAVFVLLFSVVLSLIMATPNADAYYYLGVSKLILAGKVPFLDFNLSYSPFSFYLMAPVVKLFNGSYVPILAVLYLIHGCNALLLYKILRGFTNEKVTVWFAIVYYLLACFIFDGKIYCLEPFVTFTGLLSILFIIKKKNSFALLSGIFCFFAYCSKQYGLGYMCLCILIIYFMKDGIKSKTQRFLMLFLGVCVVALFYYLFMLSQGVDMLNGSASSLQGSGYERQGVIGMLISYMYVCIIVPTLLIALYIFIKNFKSYKFEPYAITPLFGILGFMLATYVRSYPHYIQLALPFVILFIVYIISKSGHFRTEYRIHNLFLWSILIPCLFALAIDGRMVKNNFKDKRLHDACAMRQVVPENSNNVYVSDGLLGAAYINNYMPPLLKKYGMSNGFVESDDGTCDLLKNSDYCIISTKKLAKLMDKCESLRHYMKQHFLDVTEQAIGLDPHYIVLKRFK